MTMDGIPIEFISKERLQGQAFEEKLEMILEEVREGKILVLDEPLSEEEQSELIAGVMAQVDEDFPGIEFSSLDSHEDVFDRVINTMYDMVGRDRRRGLTIVGNSDVMDEVEKREDSVSLLAKSKGD